MAKLFIVLLAMMSLLAIASAMDNDEPPWKKPRKDKEEDKKDKKDKAWLCDGSFGLGFSLFVYVFVWLFVCLLCFVCLFVLCVCVCVCVCLFGLGRTRLSRSSNGTPQRSCCEA
jgi:hypothetical protein